MNFRPFSHELVKKALKLERPFSIEELGGNDIDPEALLDNSGLFFCNYDSCGTKTFISKQVFFEGSQFTVHFTREELKRKILIAAIRFQPFTLEQLPLFVLEKEIPLIMKKPSLKCLEEVHHLDHGQQLIKYLNERSEKTLLNLQSLQNEELGVYDFSSVDLQPGDHLEITLKENCLYAQIINSEDIDLQKAQLWCEKFEKSLLSVLREFGPFQDFTTQLELAYFYGPKSLRLDGPIALRDFLNLSKKIELVDFIFRKILWFSDSDPVKSSEALSSLSRMKVGFCDKVIVCDFFYLLLDEELKCEFTAQGRSTFATDDENSEIYKKLQLAVRKVALWIKNHKSIFVDDEMPAAELLMFEAAFSEFQFLCNFYIENKRFEGFIESFDEALEFNFEILVELMDFLREYYHSL